MESCVLRLQADFRRIIILIRIFYGQQFFYRRFSLYTGLCTLALKVVTENGNVELGYSPLGFYERVCLCFLLTMQENSFTKKQHNKPLTSNCQRCPFFLPADTNTQIKESKAVNGDRL